MMLRVGRWRLSIETWWEPKRVPGVYSLPWDRVQELVGKEFTPKIKDQSNERRP